MINSRAWSTQITVRWNLILLVKTPIIFKSLNGVYKQNTFRNVKRDKRCRENTTNVKHPFVITTNTRTFLLRNHLPKVWKFSQSIHFYSWNLLWARPSSGKVSLDSWSDPSQVCYWLELLDPLNSDILLMRCRRLPMVNSVSVEHGDGSDLFPIQTTQGGAPASF